MGFMVMGCGCHNRARSREGRGENGRSEGLHGWGQVAERDEGFLSALPCLSPQFLSVPAHPWHRLGEPEPTAAA